MPLTIILAGIPGSGKSTILEKTHQLLPELKIINYGDMMLKEASLQHIDKDTLRKLPLSLQQKIGIEAAKKMAMHMPELVCIDTHAMIKTPIGFCPGIPEEVIEILNPHAIGMIECSAAQIYERRKLDKTRNRDIDSIEQIEYHQQISRSFLIACTAISSALYVPISNQGTSAEAAKQLETLIRHYQIEHKEKN